MRSSPRELSQEDSMDDRSPETLLKAYTDLWMHQNKLMYDRYQTLYLIQGGFLALTYYLQSNKALALIVPRVGNFILTNRVQLGL